MSDASFSRSGQSKALLLAVALVAGCSSGSSGGTGGAAGSHGMAGKGGAPAAGGAGVAEQGVGGTAGGPGNLGGSNGVGGAGGTAGSTAAGGTAGSVTGAGGISMVGGAGGLGATPMGGAGGTGNAGIGGGGGSPIYPSMQTGSSVSTGTGAPQVAVVHISQIGQNIHIEVDGAGFGPAPVGLPAVGQLAQFGITDVTKGGWCAGRTGCAVYLQYTSWTDTAIVVDGFGLQYGGNNVMSPGDTVSIVVQSTTSGSTGTTTWTGTIQNEAPPPADPGGPVPRVAAVNFNQIGQNLSIEIIGSGFGAAPVALPAVGQLGQFGITDVTQGGWCAGRTGCAAYLQFASWTDTSIVIQGFGTQYGGNNKVVAGDAVSIYLQHSGGPEFMIWTGTLNEGSPPSPNELVPEVASVNFSGIGQNLHIDVNGSGFGTAPVALPAVGQLGQFGITDVTKGGWCAGRTGCAVYLQFTSWTDTKITIDGFGTQYGGNNKVAADDVVEIYVQHSGGPLFMIWSGTLKEGAAPGPDPGGPTPRIQTVAFSAVGAGMHIQVDGSGFGNAPVTLPATGQLGQFGITDVTKGGWCGGRTGCAVYLAFTSWTDTRIVIDGFGTQYGGNNVVAAGDAVSLYLQHSGGPEFMIWEGNLP